MQSRLCILGDKKIKMNIFSRFRRTKNKNAVSQPETIRDYYHSSLRLTTNDGTSFSCIDRIASEFASLNYAVYDTKTRQRIKKHPMYTLLKEPNKEDRHFNFFYQSAVDYYNGGCFWLKVYVYDELVSLFRLNPQQVKIKRDSKTNARIFEYNGNRYTEKEILYIPSRYDYSTLRGGQSIFKAVNSVFDTTNQLETFTQHSFTQGVVGRRTVIDISQALPNATAEQMDAIKAKFQSEYSGAENAGRPILKKKGFEYSELGTTGTDNKAAELAENRKFQEHEIAKIFGVPVEMLQGGTEKIDIEKTFTMFNEFAIRPLATQFEEAINSILDEDRFYFEFDYNGITKISLVNRIDAQIKQVNNGLLSLDEARAQNNMPPLPEEGDTHFMPVNMMPWNSETKAAYMAKQKSEAQNIQNQTDDQHFAGGDDKQ